MTPHDTLVRARAQASDASGGELVLDRYRLEVRLGSGGFGTVWQAHDEHLHRRVAVKMLVREALAGGDECALREAHMAARLAHPGIVALYEAAQTEDGWLLVSELVSGETLDQLERDGVLSDHEAVQVTIALCDALGHAHERGVVHRDVKPSNVIVPDRPASRAGVAKLTDFGVASLAERDGATRSGQVVGTAAYMAPEQAQGRPVGPEADLYSLAVVLYEALAGVNPLRDRRSALSTRRGGERLPSLARARRDLPETLVAAIDGAVHPAPDRRGTLPDLRDALARSRPQLDDQTGRVALGSSRQDAGPRLGPGHRRLGPALPTDNRDQAHGVAPSTRRARVASALAAAIVTAGALELAGVHGPLSPWLCALGSGVAVATAPGLGWLLTAGALDVYLLATNRPGIAIVTAAGVMVAALALGRWPRMLSIPAAAPALAWLGAAAVFPVLAGQASTLPRRALLGVVGAVWVMLAEALLDARLLAGPAGASGDPLTWAASATDGVDRVLVPLAGSGLLAYAGVWAIGAGVLPWIVRGRSFAGDLAGATVWAGALGLASDHLARAVSRPDHPLGVRGLLVSSVLAGLVAVALAAARAPRWAER